MIRHYDRRRQGLAFGLAALAGYVDGLGFLAAGGFFTSFMSGNSTRLGVGLAHEAEAAIYAASLIFSFVLGVVAGTLVSAIGPRRKTAVLALVTVLLGAAAWMATGEAHPFAPFVMALAMGAENLVFQRDGEVSLGVTYMTGALVKIGHHLGRALLGGPRWSWLAYLVLWLSLTSGAALGAVSYLELGPDALWIAVAVALAFLPLAWSVEADT